jgi:hypothetical protein
LRRVPEDDDAQQHVGGPGGRKRLWGQVRRCIETGEWAVEPLGGACGGSVRVVG